LYDVQSVQAALGSEQNPIIVRGDAERNSFTDPIVIMDSERQTASDSGSGNAVDPVVVE